jgi:succinoglycan biosynthesis transport protein ExoP
MRQLPPQQQLQTRETFGSQQPSAHGGQSSEPQESLLEEYMRTLIRHRMLVLVCAGCGLALALLLNVHTLPVYQTRTWLDIKSLNSDFMNMRAVDPTGNGSSDEANTNLQTQIKMLQSDTLLEAVTARLMAQPHPASIPQTDLLSRLRAGLHLGHNKPIPYAALVSDAVQRVKVKPLGLTRLVEVTCESWNAQFSAQFCNTLTTTYAEQDLKTRAQEAQSTQEWLTRQVSDLRQRAEDSQHKLEAAVGGNGLMLSQTTTSVGEDRLRSLQDELVKAQADRMQKEASADVARTAPAESLPEVQDNPQHRAYEVTLENLRQQLTQLVPTLTEQNPKVIKLRAEIADAEAGLRASASNSTGREADEYAAARHREDLLNIAFKSQESVVSSDLQKAAQVSLLRKEVDSEEQSYQTLLERAKEAGFATAMQATTIRVVDAAKPPRFAASPRRGLEGAAGLALGGIIGIVWALFRERRDRVFRVPGDVPRYLQMHELGVIPAARHLAPGTGLMRRGSLPAQAPGEAINLTRWNDNFSLSAEAYRNATLSILLAEQGKHSRSYVITSPGVGEGKTTVVSNLGVGLSKSKLRVVLIDGDLRRPKLHRAFSISNDFGLRNILRGEIDLESIPTELLTHETTLPNICVIPAGEGEGDVVELLQSSYFGALLARLSRDFDVILIDSPPVLHMADARVLAGQADGAILICRSGTTTREQAGFAAELLERDGVRVIGTILNDFDPVAEGKPNYYASYTRYTNRDPGAKVGAGV